MKRDICRRDKINIIFYLILSKTVAWTFAIDHATAWSFSREMYELSSRSNEFEQTLDQGPKNWRDSIWMPTVQSSRILVLTKKTKWTLVLKLNRKDIEKLVYLLYKSRRFQTSSKCRCLFLLLCVSSFLLFSSCLLYPLVSTLFLLEIHSFKLSSLRKRLE